ncbi:type I restriction-modification system subunit M N-terminal domain-containing protein [Candidatus Woesearchaeota archaeon]|nr:type I restriction-modification system subunit M N-terminal domain-containing protein [Candidatus Woesearchaeota archaeon]
MTTNGHGLGFEVKLWSAADKMRNNMDAAEYKHVVLGLIFLKYISDSFEVTYNKLVNDPEGDPEDKDEYIAERVFWVPKNARWGYIQDHAKQTEIGKIIDDAMESIEKENPSLKGVLPKDYARPALDKRRLGELIDLIGTIGLGDEVLKKIAREIAETVRKNTSIDWKFRENVRAGLRVIVKRLLKRYGYPPDKTAMATDLILEQAECLSNKWIEEDDLDSYFTEPNSMVVADKKK